MNSRQSLQLILALFTLCLGGIKCLQAADSDAQKLLCVLVRVQDFDGQPLEGATVTWSAPPDMPADAISVPEPQRALLQFGTTDSAGQTLRYVVGMQSFAKDNGIYYRLETIRGTLEVKRPGYETAQFDLAKALSSPFKREENRLAAVNVAMKKS